MVNMLWPSPHDSIGFIERDCFSSHLTILFLLIRVATVTTRSTAAALFTDHAVQLAAPLALFAFGEFDEHYFLRLFLNPPKWPFFLGCVRWITRIASFAKPSVLRRPRRNACTLVTFMLGRARRSPLARARRCRAEGGLPAGRPKVPMRPALPLSASAPAAPAAEITGCLTMPVAAALTAFAPIVRTPVGIAEMAFEAIPPTPGMNEARLDPTLLMMEKKPGSPE